VTGVVQGFIEHDLLTYASSIAFRVMFALIPFGCFGLALLGFLHLSDVWHSHAAPDLEHHVSPAVYAVVNQVAINVLSHQQLFWLTAGLAIALWSISGAVRAVMSAFDVIYGGGRGRPIPQGIAVSLAISPVVSLLLICALFLIRFGSIIYRGDPTALVVVLGTLRWAVAAGLISAAVGTLVHFAPAQKRPLPWVSVGTVGVMVLWLAATALYGLYLTDLASYGSVFAGLAAVIILMSYLYISAVVFLAGAMVDTLLRRRVQDGSGAHQG
jgi:membrane protein